MPDRVGAAARDDVAPVWSVLGDRAGELLAADEGVTEALAETRPTSKGDVPPDRVSVDPPGFCRGRSK
jgi:hypothetical protein